MWGRMVAWGLRRCARACGAQTLGRSNGYFNKQHPARALSLVRACSLPLYVCMHGCARMYVCIRACVHACMDGWMDMEEAAEARFNTSIVGCREPYLSGSAGTSGC